MDTQKSSINALLGIYKPPGVTSHDVVYNIRQLLGIQKVGHAGTLDPFASGVLIVGVGQATRLLNFLVSDTKRYIGEVTFGYETESDDIEGEIRCESKVSEELLSTQFAKEILASFLGFQKQVPPNVSAIKVNGKKSYVRARKGEVFELEPRDICIYRADLQGIDVVNDAPVWHIDFEVSKGTYIRSLARDIGRRAHSGAHLSSLIRTVSGNVQISECASLDDIKHRGVNIAVLSPKKVLGLDTRHLSERELRDVICGRPLQPHIENPLEGHKVLYIRNDKLYAIAKLAETNVYKTQAVFPDGILCA